MKKSMRAVLLSGLMGFGLLGTQQGVSAATIASVHPPHQQPNVCRPRGWKHCCPAAYNERQCRGQHNGELTVSLAGTRVTLTGKGTRHTANSTVSLTRVTMQHLVNGAQAFRVLANGPIPALKLVTKGKLYRYVPSTNGWAPVGAVTGTGIYEAVLR